MMPRIYKKCSASSEIADETLSTKAVQSPQIIRILTFSLFQAVRRANRTLASAIVRSGHCFVDRLLDTFGKNIV
jgi:hypothetical protein